MISENDIHVRYPRIYVNGRKTNSKLQRIAYRSAHCNPQWSVDGPNFAIYSDDGESCEITVKEYHGRVTGNFVDDAEFRRRLRRAIAQAIRLGKVNVE